MVGYGVGPESRIRGDCGSNPSKFFRDEMTMAKKQLFLRWTCAPDIPYIALVPDWSGYRQLGYRDLLFRLRVYRPLAVLAVPTIDAVALLRHPPLVLQLRMHSS